MRSASTSSAAPAPPTAPWSGERGPVSTAGWPPGWYPDPAGSGWVRWWDGQAWSRHLQPPGPAGPEALARLVRGELRLLPWASTATAIAGAAALVYLVAVLAVGPDVVAVHHEVVQQPARGVVFSWSAQSRGYGFLVGLVQLACLAVFLVWQSRAAVVGRAAGYPARHSPGWGVGSWFVPVANLWVPFQSLEDCLPPGASGRGRVWLIMAGWVSGATLGWVGMLATFFGGSVELLTIGTALETAAIAVAWLTVLRVGRAHRALVGSTPGG